MRTFLVIVLFIEIHAQKVVLLKDVYYWYYRSGLSEVEGGVRDYVF